MRHGEEQAHAGCRTGEVGFVQRITERRRVPPIRRHGAGVVAEAVIEVAVRAVGERAAEAVIGVAVGVARAVTVVPDRRNATAANASPLPPHACRVGARSSAMSVMSAGQAAVAGAASNSAVSSESAACAAGVFVPTKTPADFRTASALPKPRPPKTRTVVTFVNHMAQRFTTALPRVLVLPRLCCGGAFSACSVLCYPFRWCFSLPTFPDARQATIRSPELLA